MSSCRACAVQRLSTGLQELSPEQVCGMLTTARSPCAICACTSSLCHAELLSLCRLLLGVIGGPNSRGYGTAPTHPHVINTKRGGVAEDKRICGLHRIAPPVSYECPTQGPVPALRR